MSGVSYYRDADLPCFEIKFCDTQGLAYKIHNHEELALGIVDQGASRFWCEGSEAIVHPGSFVVIPPGIFHSCNPADRRTWRYKMLFVQLAWLEKISDNRLVFAAYAGENNLLRRAMAPLAARLTGDAAPLEKETRLVDFLTGALAGERERPLPVSGGADRKRLEMVREYLHAHYGERVTLDELESLSGFSKSYLLRLFRREYQVSPHAYQTVLRINFAKRQLARRRPIAEVSLEAGFYDQSHFTKMFKQHVGSTPESYRKH